MPLVIEQVHLAADQLLRPLGNPSTLQTHTAKSFQALADKFKLRLTPAFISSYTADYGATTGADPSGGLTILSKTREPEKKLEAAGHLVLALADHQGD